MKVLHVMEATIGGTRRHIVDVAAGQKSLGLDVEMVVSTLRQVDFERDLARLAALGVRVTRMPMVREIAPATDARHLARLARHLEQARPDVVHTHSSKAGALGRLASIASGVGARVHTPHTFAFLFEEMFGRAKRRFFFDLERGLAARTAALIAVSAGEAATIAASGVAPSERVRCVPNGIDPTPYREAAPYERAAFGLDPGRPTLLVAGLLNAAKGQDLALDALARPGLERLQILFAGHGELESELKSRATRLRLDERARFLGFRDDMPRLLATCDALLLPSRWEGMPYVALEAFASARPVVATPVDGARDIVVDGVNGFLAARVDADSLAEALRRFLDTDERTRADMGRAGRERTRNEFSARRMVERLVAVYEEVA